MFGIRIDMMFDNMIHTFRTAMISRKLFRNSHTFGNIHILSIHLHSFHIALISRMRFGTLHIFGIRLDSHINTYSGMLTLNKDLA